MSDPSTTTSTTPAEHGATEPSPVEAPAVELGPPTVERPAYGLVLVVGGGLAVLGAFLPWITLTGRGARAVTAFLDAQGGGLAGLDHGGSVSVVLGALAIGLGVGRLLGRLPRAGIVGGLIGLVLVALVGQAAARPDDLVAAFGEQVGPFEQTVGVGVWLTAAAAAVLLIGSVVDLVAARSADQPGGAASSSAASRASSAAT